MTATNMMMMKLLIVDLPIPANHLPYDTPVISKIPNTHLCSHIFAHQDCHCHYHCEWTQQVSSADPFASLVNYTIILI
jgi:hypothetical protein